MYKEFSHVFHLSQYVNVIGSFVPWNLFEDMDGGKAVGNFTPRSKLNIVWWQHYTLGKGNIMFLSVIPIPYVMVSVYLGDR